ncbi:MAG: hypothetical protein C0616_10485 [Desulfuromonas sp.]|nr:MAG: hypothetical protein C0616_10485 [Desulfuromonas sp.]
MLEYLDLGILTIGTICAAAPILLLQGGGFLLGVIMFWLADLFRIELITFIDPDRVAMLTSPEWGMSTGLVHGTIACISIYLISRLLPSKNGRSEPSNPVPQPE